MCSSIKSVYSVWGISSDGRAPDLHAGGTGIDTQILQLFSFLLICLLLSVFVIFLNFVCTFVSEMQCTCVP